LGILFSSILCPCPNQRNLCNLIVSVIVGYFNPLAYTAACEAVWAIDVFAFSSSFLSTDGMTCHISF
jgi:hypothetical protein